VFRAGLLWAADRMWIIGTVMMVVSTPLMIMSETEKTKVLGNTQPLAAAIQQNKGKQDELTNRLLASGAKSPESVKLESLPFK